MTDLPIEGKLVPIVQGQRVADAINIGATGDSGATVQAAINTLATDVATNRRAIQDNTGGAPDLTSLRSKVDALYPLTSDVDILTDWSDVYNPAQASEEVRPVAGYSSFIDFRLVSDRYESAGITYTAGTDVANYSGLTDDLHRCFGFRVSAPSNQTLLWIIDGATAIPLVDMTAGGNFRVNNFVPARAQDQVVTDHPVLATRSAGTGTIAVSGAVSTYLVPAYPGNTSNQSRSGDVDFDVLINGADSRAGGGIALEIPDDLTAQSQRTVTHNFFLGWPSNRTVTATIAYEVRVDGSDLRIDLTLQSAPSDVTLRVNNLTVLQSYTATVVIPRVDQFTAFEDTGSTFTFTGDHELLIAFHPIPNSNLMNVVPVVINTTTGATTQLNDVAIAEPSPGFDEIRIPEAIEFRTFLPDHFLNHSDLVSLLRDRATKWVYALARLEEVASRVLTQSLDLAAGTTLDGEAIQTGSPQRLVHFQATGVGTGPGELAQSTILPANYASYDFVFITIRAGGVPVEWRIATIDTALLNSSDIGAAEVVRVQGDEDFSWTAASRSLFLQSGQKIWRVVLAAF